MRDKPWRTLESVHYICGPNTPQGETGFLKVPSQLLDIVPGVGCASAFPAHSGKTDIFSGHF
jgi:hypothetical protein